MKYISLGYFCSIAIELEKFGLRTESSPFDWVISDFEGVILAIQEHFCDFLNYEYLSQNKQKHEIYKNTKYNISFFHDFDKYSSLKKQLPEVQEKYSRRINRFYESIKEPTLFIRYISDEVTIDGISKELIYIEKNYDQIINLIKSFNIHNEILFIGNEGVTSEKLIIYNVSKDENDVVARSPIHKNSTLFNEFSRIDLPNKQVNINKYKIKEKKKNRLYSRVIGKIIAKLKQIFYKEYSHDSQY